MKKNEKRNLRILLFAWLTVFVFVMAMCIVFGLPKKAHSWSESSFEGRTLVIKEIQSAWHIPNVPKEIQDAKDAERLVNRDLPQWRMVRQPGA